VYSGLFSYKAWQDRTSGQDSFPTIRRDFTLIERNRHPAGKQVEPLVASCVHLLILAGEPKPPRFAFDNDHFAGFARYRVRQLLLYPLTEYRHLCKVTVSRVRGSNANVKALKNQCRKGTIAALYL